MANNRSLDDFRSDEATDDTEDATPNPGGDGISPTYTWSPDGAACAACGAVVERRWREDGDLVCPACKSW